MQPEKLGFKRESLQDLTVEGVESSLQLITAALAGDKTKRAQSAANMIALNAGAALYVAGLADSIFDGVSRIQKILWTIPVYAASFFCCVIFF